MTSETGANNGRRRQVVETGADEGVRTGKERACHQGQIVEKTSESGTDKTEQQDNRERQHC